MGSALFRDGKRVFRNGGAVFTSDPSGCECCGDADQAVCDAISNKDPLWLTIEGVGECVGCYQAKQDGVEVDRELISLSGQNFTIQLDFVSSSSGIVTYAYNADGDSAIPGTDVVFTNSCDGSNERSGSLGAYIKLCGSLLGGGECSLREVRVKSAGDTTGGGVEVGSFYAESGSCPGFGSFSGVANSACGTKMPVSSSSDWVLLGQGGTATVSADNPTLP